MFIAVKNEKIIAIVKQINAGVINIQFKKVSEKKIKFDSTNRNGKN